MAKKRRPRKNDKNQFRGPREEARVYRGPADEAPSGRVLAGGTTAGPAPDAVDPAGPDQVAADLTERSGGSIPADVARRVARTEPGLAAAVAEELDNVPAAFRRPQSGAVIPPRMAGPANKALGRSGSRSAYQVPDLATDAERDYISGRLGRSRPGTIPAKMITGGGRDDGEPGLPAGMQPGDIIAAEQPLGYTETDIDLSGEKHIEAGSKVYRVADQDMAAAVEAARDAGYDPVDLRPGEALDILRTMDPGAGSLRRQPDVIVTDDMASLPPGTDPGLVIDMPGDDDYPGAPTRPVPEGMFLPPGFTPSEPGPPRVMSLSAAAVLAVHDRLAATMKNPPAALLGMFGTYIGEALAKSEAESGLAGMHSKWMGTFWPAKSAPKWCGVLARQLGTARTYQVSPEMAGEVTGLYRVIQEHGKAPWVDQAEVPWPAGFAWLDAPLDFRDRWNRVVYTRALSWDVVYIPYEHATVPGIRVVSWTSPADRDAYWAEDHARFVEENGGLSMGNSLVVPFGQRMFTQRFTGYPASDSTAAWIKALWHVMESEISVTAKARDPQRAPGWRPRSLTHGEVHVVLLRRKNAITPGSIPSGTGSKNWTCRWFVGEFWRHVRRDARWEADNEERDEKNRLVRHHAIPDHTRERCIRCGARVAHVATFDKGPPGLPFRQSRQLHRLTR